MLKSELSKLVAEAANLNEDGIFVEYPRDASHGDYASTIALKLAKQKQLPPREVAEAIIAELKSLDDYELPEIAGPGFINFKLKNEALVKELELFLKAPNKYRLPKIPENNRIICEYSQPNVAKPLGIHHLLSTVIGQALANIYEYLGYEVTKINHIGDWGTQFGKLIYAIKTWGDRKEIAANPIDQLLKLYVKFHEEAEKDDSLDDKGRAEFKKLEDGDAENRELWEWIVNESMLDVQKTYDLLGGIEFDHIMGESFYEEKMAPLIKEGLEQKIFTVGEGGAIIAEFTEAEKLPTTIIQRSDGATVYLTRDIATLKYRIKTWDPAKIIYVVDVAQKLHFQQIKLIGEKLGIIKKDDDIFKHVIFGRMQFADKKMSTRKGNILLLDNVLKEAVDKAKLVIENKSDNLPETEKDSVAYALGVGGVKYAILSQNRITNIIFDWDKVINLEGNSATYLQYTYARAASILREADTNTFDLSDQDLELTESEKTVLRLLPKFTEFIELAAKDYKPNLLSEYLFNYAQAFNSFYNSDKILKADPKKLQLRLAICSATKEILRIGLGLLAGINCPERM